MIEPEQIARRLDRRDATSVVAYREVGLPIFRVNSLLTLQEAGPLGAIEEFVLRCIANGVNSANDMEVFLGLPSRIVTHQLGQLLYEGAIRQTASAPPQYGLTSGGKRRIEDMSLIRVSKERIPIYVDGITRRVVPVDTRELWSNAQLEELGVSVVPPTPRRPPRASEVDLADINRMFSLLSVQGRANKRAVRFDAVIGRINVVFRRAVAIAFKSDDGRKMSIAFAIDGHESQEHEIEYARSKDMHRSVLFGAMFDADKRRRDIQIVGRELRSDLPDLVPVEQRGHGGRPILRIRKQNGADQEKRSQNVRVLSVYDHPPLLKQAFESAKSRVLIVSPWIRSNVVDQDFIQRLISCLERGVEVTIAYGISRHDRRERLADKTARESLAALTQSFPNFRLVHKGDTHAKVLLVDSSFFVTTSFNWLSFRGDPRQPMREEEGTIVEDADLVEQYYRKLEARIATVT